MKVSKRAKNDVSVILATVATLSIILLTLTI